MKSETRATFSDRAGAGVAWRPQQLSTLAILAIIGEVVLLASGWLLPLVSEFSLVGDNISELVLGRYGFIQTIAFLVAGVGTLALAYVIWQLTRGTRGAAIGSLLVTIYGVGAILVALFPTDRVDSPADVWAQSTTGTIHMFAALISFVSMIIGMFVLTWTFARQARWRPLVIGSALCAGGALALFFVQNEGPLVGLMQRLLVTIIATWIIMVASWARTITADDEHRRHVRSTKEVME